MILSASQVLIGLGFLLVPGMQGIGASFIGAGIGSFAGGHISEALGYDYEIGSLIGGIIGAYVGGMVYRSIHFSQCGINCFKAGTLVLCKDDDDSECHKKIEDIEVGDLVYAYDEETGESDWKEVIQLFRNVSSHKTSVKIKAEDGTVDEIISTPGHKYYLLNNKQNRESNERLEHASYEGLSERWVSACALKKGDRVLLSDERYGTVKGVKTEVCEEWTTYNLEVADFHTYYVGEQGVLVYNANCGPKSPKLMKDNYLKKNGIDPHQFKIEILGDKAQIARYDIYIDKVDDMLWLGSKGSPTRWVETFTKFGGG